PLSQDVIPKRSKTNWLWPSAAVVLLGISAVLAFLYLRPKPAVAERQTRFQIPLPESTNVTLFSVSPDGQRLVFAGVGPGGSAPRLWIRTLDALEARALPETDGASARMFWSPDSRFIGFAAQGKLKKIDPSGGPPQTICDLPGPYAGGTWNADGLIL